MVDEELVLRFFAFAAELDEYRPSLKRFLNDFMYENRTIDNETQQEMTSQFETAIKTLHSLVGPYAFRLIDHQGNPVERPINRAIVDAQLLASSWVTTPNPEAFRQAAQGQIAQLNESANFLDSIRRATGDRSRTLTRVRLVVQALANAGLELNVPFDLDD